MGRHTDMFIEQGPSKKASMATQLNLAYGGQHGFAADVGNYISNASYVSKPVIAFLIDAPKLFQKMEDSAGLVEALRSILEEHSEQIEGLDSSVSISDSDTAIGGSQEIQQDVLDVTRNRSAPVHTLTEKYGESIKNFLLYSWVYPLLQDPDTKYPWITMRDDVTVDDLLPDNIAATVLYVEPDATGRKAAKAWLLTNVRPTGDIEEIGNRDKRSGGQTRQIPLNLTGIQTVGRGVLELAQRKLDEAHAGGAGPFFQKAIVDDVSADVAAANSGYTASIERMKGNSL